MTDRLFAQLKPEKLEELAEEGYARRRSADLARILQSPRSSRSRRLPLLAGGAAAAGLAAAAAVVVLSGTVPITAPPAAPPTDRATDRPTDRATEGPAAHTPLVAKPVNARTFLLAAAVTASREPATSGRYWYVRERTLQKVHVVPDEYMATIKALDEEHKRRVKDGGDAGAAEKEFERKVEKLKRSELPYAAFAADTGETWRAVEKGDANRSIRNEDVAVTFGSPQDEAAWKAAGSPELVEKKPRTSDDTLERILSIDNPSLTIQNVSQLPTGKEALERRLDTLYEQRQNGAQLGRAVYLWQTGVDLMTAPIRPGTRAALFKVLADQDGIASKGQVTDVLGRTGVALETPGADGVGYRLVIDEGTAELLQYEVTQNGQPLLRVALAQTGWTDRLGERPEK